MQWRLAQDVIGQGLSVIIVSTCNYSEVVEQGSALAARNGYAYWYVECKVRDINLLDRRLRTRAPMISQRTAIDFPPATAQDGACVGKEDARALFARWIESPCRPEGHVVVVNSTGEPEMICDEILKQIVG